MDGDGIKVKVGLESKIDGSILTNVWCICIFEGFSILYDSGVMSQHKTVRTRVRKLLTTGGRCTKGILNEGGQRCVRSTLGGSAHKDGSAVASGRRRWEERRGEKGRGAIRAKDC